MLLFRSIALAVWPSGSPGGLRDTEFGNTNLVLVFQRPCLNNVQVKFHDGEGLSWNKVPTTINNLILGKIYVDFAGTMRVTSNVHKNEMRVKFKDTGAMFGASKRLVSGSSFEGGVERPAFKYDVHLSLSRIVPTHHTCVRSSNCTAISDIEQFAVAGWKVSGVTT